MVWQSHDGVESRPSLWNMSMWKYFYPDDPRGSRPYMLFTDDIQKDDNERL